MTTARMPTLPFRPADLLAQATAGEYEILNELGRGGMAVVYLAREVALDRRVAIKVILPSVVDGEEAVERFKREARTAASLSHPGIIPIYAVRQSDHALFFVMKAVQGRTLSSIVRSAGPLPVTLVRNIVSSVALALDHAHRHGVIHRDIKPGNIMVDVEGHVVVTDFGIAKVAESAGLTTTGRTIGTPAYMSPEACAGRGIDASSDQYSLGVVAYELLAGRNPFLAENQVGVMYAQVHEDPQPVGELRPDCPPEVAAAVMRMLAKDPAARFGSLKEVAQAIQGNSLTDEMAIASLGALAASRGQSDSAIPTPVPRRTPVRTGTTTTRLRRRTLVGVVLTTGVLVALVVFGTGPWRRLGAEPAVDTALIASRAAAQAARSRATAAGIPAPQLAPGDSIMSIANREADSGRTAEAAALFTLAGNAWDSLLVQRTGRPVPSRPAGSPPQAESLSAPPGQAEPARNDSSEIAAYYQELEQAIESRQLGEVRRLLPNLTNFEAERWRGTMDGATAIEASYAVLAVTGQGGQIHARVREQMTVSRGSPGSPRAREYFATLTKGPQGWRQIAEEKIQ